MTRDVRRRIALAFTLVVWGTFATAIALKVLDWFPFESRPIPELHGLREDLDRDPERAIDRARAWFERRAESSRLEPHQLLPSRDAE